MKYLLDTHALIWLLTDSQKLSANARKIIEEADNHVVVSAISFWEISLKYALGKLQLVNYTPQSFYQAIHQIDIPILPITGNICASVYQLEAAYHKDPFDRLLIWLAIQENYTLISSDSTIALYRSEGLAIFW